MSPPTPTRKRPNATHCTPSKRVAWSLTCTAISSGSPGAGVFFLASTNASHGKDKQRERTGGPKGSFSIWVCVRLCVRGGVQAEQSPLRPKTHRRKRTQTHSRRAHMAHTHKVMVVFWFVVQGDFFPVRLSGRRRGAPSFSFSCTHTTPQATHAPHAALSPRAACSAPTRLRRRRRALTPLTPLTTTPGAQPRPAHTTGAESTSSGSKPIIAPGLT